ncbi:MAG: hypothetical protein KIS94_14030 [Chitinophagales bacterium]|nr:hypothetical protein [Chitinophagales bacterium]
MRRLASNFLSIFFTVFLAMGIMVESTGKGGILISYLINKTYIAANLCENKNNKASHCNGKCYLAKQLKQQDDRQHDSSAPLPLVHHEEMLMDVPVCVLELSLPYHFSLADFSPTSSSFISRRATDIFHPPA